jgi:hypothetical protein
MKRSCYYRALALIVPLLAVGFFGVQLDLAQNAEAAPKSEPVAVIVGPNFQVSVGRTVTVDGSLSYGSSGKKLHYNWELVKAPPDSSAKITKKNSATPSFTPDKHGRYVIELTVHNGIKSSASVSLTLTTEYTGYDLVPVNTRVYQQRNIQNTPQGNYGIQVGTNTYWAPAYYTGTGTATATGFQVLVLDRSSLLPAQNLQSGYTSNQSFGGNAQGYSAMTTFLATLTSTGLLVFISSIDDNSALDTYSGKTALVTQIKNLGGTDDFTWLGAAGWSPYSLIGIPGFGPGNGFEMYGPKQRDPSSQTIQGVLTKDKYENFQFIYPNFTQFETKSWANPDGSYSGSIKVGDQEIPASIPGGHFPAGQGGFQVVYLMRENLDWQTVPMEYELNPMVYQTNVPGQESRAVKTLVSDLKTAAFWEGYSWPRPDCLIVIIQSIGVPFGSHSLYDAQSIEDLEKLINNLGGTEATFHAIYNNPGTPASPNKYSLLGIAANGMDPMPTSARLGPAESVEASTLKLQEDGSWTVSNSDGNVRGVVNQNNQGMYAPFLASEGVPNVDLSLPSILFQDPTPWITGEAGKDSTPYLAAYSWISTYIWPSLKQQTGAKPDDLRTSYPVIDNPWDTVLSILNGVPIEQAVQTHLAAYTDFSYVQYQFMRDQLIQEVTKVQKAYTLFQKDILEFFKDLALNQSFSLSAFYTNAYGTLGIGNPEQTNTTQSILDLVHAVSKQVQIIGLAKAKPVVAVIGGIVSAGLAIASHFIPDQTTDPVGGIITTTIQDLWQDLSTNYLTEDFVARKSYELAVSDWGKLQAAENIWNKWNEDSRDEALAAMTAGFEAYLYQVLIPAATYIVEPMPGTQYSKPGDFRTCQETVINPTCDPYGWHWDVPSPNYVTLASQAWDPLQARQAHDIYSVYKGKVSTGQISYLPAETLNNIFAPFDFYAPTKLGVSKVDFFTRWPFNKFTVWVEYDQWCYTCGTLW